MMDNREVAEIRSVGCLTEVQLWFKGWSFCVVVIAYAAADAQILQIQAEVQNLLFTGMFLPHLY